MTRSHEVGDRIALDDIEPGDKIRFETKYTRAQEDTVELIIPMEAGLRKRVFCDTRKHSINHFPDTVTDAFVVSLTGDWTPGAEEDIVDGLEGNRKVKEEAEERFRAFKKGTVLSKQERDRQFIYTKFGKNKWMWVEIFKRDDTFITDTEYVTGNDTFYELYDFDNGDFTGVTVFEHES